MRTLFESSESEFELIRLVIKPSKDSRDSVLSWLQQNHEHFEQTSEEVSDDHNGLSVDHNVHMELEEILQDSAISEDGTGQSSCGSSYLNEGIPLPCKA